MPNSLSVVCTITNPNAIGTLHDPRMVYFFLLQNTVASRLHILRFALAVVQLKHNETGVVVVDAQFALGVGGGASFKGTYLGTPTYFPPAKGWYPFYCIYTVERVYNK